MRDLPADFRSDRYTGCLDNNVRASVFVGYHSRAFRGLISVYETSNISKLFVIYY